MGMRNRCRPMIEKNRQIKNNAFASRGDSHIITVEPQGSRGFSSVPFHFQERNYASDTSSADRKYHDH